MSTFRNPVGPQPASVYWRRRLVLALGLIAVVVVIVLIVVRPGGAAPAPAPSPSTPEAGSTPTPGAASANPVDAADCDPAKVTISPITDATSYDPGVNPVLSFTLKSTMTVPCRLSAGSDVQLFSITSGEELIWSSRDCQTDPVAATIVLQPGVPFQGSSMTWDRTRSSVDTCDAARDPVIGDGASYHLKVSVGDIVSAETRQFLVY